MLLRRTADAGQRHGSHVDLTSVHSPEFGLRAGEIIRKLPPAAVEI